MKRTPKVLLASIILTVAAWTLAQESSSRQFLNLPGRSDDLPFSHAVLSGDTLFIAGSIGLDPQTGLPPESVEEEVRILMNGIKQKLELAGMTMDDLVSVQVYSPDLSLYDRFNAVYRTYFTDGRFPARAFVGSGPLLRNGRFELIATAVRR